MMLRTRPWPRPPLRTPALSVSLPLLTLGRAAQSNPLGHKETYFNPGQREIIDANNERKKCLTENRFRYARLPETARACT
jgi:hypothetical protein